MQMVHLNQVGTTWLQSFPDEAVQVKTIVGNRIMLKLQEPGYESSIIPELCVHQVAPTGDISVTKNGAYIGTDEFLELTKDRETIILPTAFMRGNQRDEDPRYRVGEGYIKIEKEGTCKVFVPEMEYVSVRGADLLRMQKKLVFITERCVFELREEGLLLSEIIPGVDIRKDILDQMDFMPQFCENLSPMPTEVFDKNI